jgi:glycosyltransferase involved in cell wall biosynthesis
MTTEIKPKMIYVMRVSWYWIHQRPHFLALGLQQYYDITVLYRKSLRHLRDRDPRPDFCRGIMQIPFDRFGWIAKLNRWLFRKSLQKKMATAHILWFAHPEDYMQLRDLIPDTTRLVYDCMDDLCEFPGIKGSALEVRLRESEKMLCDRADCIFASSAFLKNILQTRYPSIKEIRVINNALDKSFLEKQSIETVTDYPEKSGFTDLLYIGTISEWFDFKLLSDALETFPSLRIILIGPAKTALPAHERMIHLGSRPHASLPAYMQQADALIMPFVINDLILAVNPVKLYEYIISGKAVITCNYEEIRPFGKYVYAYNSKDEFLALINTLIKAELTVESEDSRRAFLNRNTWQGRLNEIHESLMLL